MPVLILHQQQGESEEQFYVNSYNTMSYLLRASIIHTLINQHHWKYGTNKYATVAAAFHLSVCMSLHNNSHNTLKKIFKKQARNWGVFLFHLNLTRKIVAMKLETRWTTHRRFRSTISLLTLLLIFKCTHHQQKGFRLHFSNPNLVGSGF